MSPISIAYLAMAIAAFVSLGVTLFAVQLWSNAKVPVATRSAPQAEPAPQADLRRAA